jgi:probable FeS assembly SUF system protein SufT
MRFEEVVTRRAVEVVQIPDGITTVLPAGTPLVIMQSLGDTFTVSAPTLGGMYRLAGEHADAIGRERPLPADAPVPDGPVDEARVWAALRTVYDPEIPVNVVELGLVYDLRVDPLPGGGSRVQVKMTLTAPGCGMGPIIADDAKRRIEGVPGVKQADVEVVFDPPWDRSMMSEAAKLELGLL